MNWPRCAESWQRPQKEFCNDIRHVCSGRPRRGVYKRRRRCEGAKTVARSCQPMPKQGKPRHVAEALAAEDVKLALKKEAGDAKHVMLAQIAAARRSQALVDGSQRLATLMTDRLEHAANSPNRGATIVATKQALMRAFHKRLEGVIREHSRSLLGNVRNPAGLRNVVRELHGESSGDVVAYAVADAVRTAFEDMRLMFNGAGGTIGKLENWGLPHTHNRTAMRRAGVVAWADEVRSRLAWDKIEDDLTGRPWPRRDRCRRPTCRTTFSRRSMTTSSTGAWTAIALGCRVRGRHCGDGAPTPVFCPSGAQMTGSPTTRSSGPATRSARSLVTRTGWPATSPLRANTDLIRGPAFGRGRPMPSSAPGRKETRTSPAGSKGAPRRGADAGDT